MEWLGGKIKDLIKENNSSIVKLAEKNRCFQADSK